MLKYRQASTHDDKLSHQLSATVQCRTLAARHNRVLHIHALSTSTTTSQQKRRSLSFPSANRLMKAFGATLDKTSHECCNDVWYCRWKRVVAVSSMICRGGRTVDGRELLLFIVSSMICQRGKRSPFCRHV